MGQQDLFEPPGLAIPGARYLRDWLSQAERDSVIGEIDARPWLDDLQRRVQHYGYRYDYKARRVTRDMYLGELPAFLHVLAERLVGERLFESIPDQAIVNEYTPGQGISAHVDCVPCFGPTIATLSTGSECEMEFQNAATKDVQRTMLQVGSLLVLSAESRYDWTHAIRGRASDHGKPRGRRLSITFRTVIDVRSPAA